ncbi:carboxymuconolactone decarboxylase family protein [Streptomyces beihaiensis]|uniref:Carboxymuconolactone decarboxylase family protein n=1 Tax=Streptomyces beihaiensis TaxID=2984495 RepID=A0ABT3U2U2_9ACTN|nr:carboxymuconolactone decarboxylase family protein [Streptomyces beihaiensis]MCX3063624.1 carboxymuconolactone decarboxylase family protein [Streptomyces beihaiensis]
MLLLPSCAWCSHQLYSLRHTRPQSPRRATPPRHIRPVRPVRPIRNARSKELIGIGIHAETKCRYCTLFHTEAAKLFGATDEEIQEAVHFAKYTVGWSTYLNGMREDYDTFAREVQLIKEHLESKAEV